MNIEERLTRIEAHLFGKTEQLRDFVVPLAHATLTREEVAERCIAAAENKGYRADKDREYSDFRIYANKNCRQPRYFITNRERDGYGFRFQDTLKNHDEYTLEAFEEYCGVEQPLPTGNSEKPNTHEATEQPVYEAGFWFSGENQCLCLLNETKLWYSIKRQAWLNDANLSENRDPHTLTPVETHTVGKFYALAGIDGEHLNDWRSYALCVKNEDVPYFVRPTSEYGIVSIDRIRPSHVSNLEVTPV